MGIDVAGPAALLMRAVTEVYDKAGEQLPERRFLAPGPLAAWDGEHVAVTLTSTLPGTSDTTATPGGRPARGIGSVSIPRGAYALRVLRCIPTVNDHGDVPTADELTAASERLLLDCGLLLDAMYRWAELLPRGAVCTVGESNALGPEGGLAGYQAIGTVSPLGGSG